MSKTEKAAKDSMRAAYNKTRNAVTALSNTMAKKATLVDGFDIADMRDEVEIITQRFHEFSAYWNVVNTE